MANPLRFEMDPYAGVNAEALLPLKRKGGRDLADNLVTVVSLLILQKKPGDAISMLQSYEQMVVENPKLLVKKGIAHLSFEESQKAKQCFEAAIRLNPNCLSARRELMRMEREVPRSKRGSDALESYQAALNDLRNGDQEVDRIIGDLQMQKTTSRHKRQKKVGNPPPINEGG